MVLLHPNFSHAELDWYSFGARSSGRNEAAERIGKALGLDLASRVSVLDELGRARYMRYMPNSTTPMTNKRLTIGSHLPPHLAPIALIRCHRPSPAAGTTSASHPSPILGFSRLIRRWRRLESCPGSFVGYSEVASFRLAVRWQGWRDRCASTSRVDTNSVDVCGGGPCLEQDERVLEDGR
jgi:hypothetical protein